MRRAVALLSALLRSAARGLRGSAVTSAIAVFTIAVTLVLVGGFTLLVSNMSGVLERFGEELQVVAYLDEGLDSLEQAHLAASIETVEGVERVVLVSKDEALERFRERLGGASLLEGLEENPLPASIEVALLPGSRTPEGLEIVLDSLRGLPGVTELAHGQDWVEGYARFAALVRAGALGLGLVLSLASLMIVANTIRLAVYAREDELEILALVGASRSFVRVPFVIEGAVQGCLGGALAVLLLFGAFRLVLPQLEYGLQLVLGSSSPEFLSTAQGLGLVIAGAALGLVGSITALVGWRTSP